METDMSKQLLSRRRFNSLCAASGLSLPTAAALQALSATRAIAADFSRRTVTLGNGTIVPAVGQGTWHLGQGRHPAELEEEALRTGLSLGMTLIDTSGNYGNGRSEELIRHVIAGQRDRVFLVSKVENNEVSGELMARACDASLRRLGTDYLDLYLLHWPVSESNSPPLSRDLSNCAQQGKSEPGAYPTSVLPRWKHCSAFRMAPAARLIKSPTV